MTLSLPGPALCEARPARSSDQGQNSLSLSKNGSKDASLNEPQIRAWWQEWPNANIGLATGHRWFAVDIDIKRGGQETWDMSSISMPALAGLKPLREPQQVRNFVMAETQRVEAAPAYGASADDEFLPRRRRTSWTKRPNVRRMLR